MVGTGIVKFTQNNNEFTKAMYLEVGTWGTVTGAAYRIDTDSVKLEIGDSDYFDELVGITEDDDTGSTNAVVSLAVRNSSRSAVCIDKPENNTYKGQIKNYKNTHARYYYNLDSYRKKNTDLSSDSISIPENLVLWSVSQYAAENIRTYFRKSPTNTTTITGDIDLTGYSYYPVTPLCEVKVGDGSSDTVLTFGYESMNAFENDNKLLSDPEHQHHLMQHGLLFNVVQNVTVNKLTMKGSVGKETDNSGALIFGSVKGDTTTKTVVVTLKEVTLSGIRVADIQESDTYAPLLINRMEQAVRLAVDTLSTGGGYTSGSYAATSLIGYVGSATATKLTLSFSNIALDGRKAADSAKSTCVYNNGTKKVEYHTTHTIFTRATLMESFMYSSAGSGSYNFNSDDSMVSDAAKNRVSYLIKNYTTGTAAARLAGKSSAETNIPVNLTFDAEKVDMTSYDNGFRGIGGSYGENKKVWNNDCTIKKTYRRNLLVKSINSDRTNATTIMLNMNQNDYNEEFMKGSWINRGAGLFVDFNYIDTCTVKYLKLSGNIKVGLYNLNNGSASLEKVSKRDTEKDYPICVGGFAARTANSKGQATFEYLYLESINAYGGSMTGVAIGLIDGYNNNNARNVTFKNWSIKDENVLKWVYNDGSAGGLVGWNVGYGKLTINNDTSETPNVENLTVTTLSIGKNTAAAGGLVGACDYSSVSISGINAVDLTVTGTNLRDAGGLIAGLRTGSGIIVKDCSVEDCILNAISISNQNDNDKGNTGGVVGRQDVRLAISSVSIGANSNISGQQYTGGFTGYSGAAVQISSCIIEKTNISNTSRNWVGGFIGCFYTDATAVFKNCQEKNVNIIGKYSGGLTGSNKGSISASNVEFANTMVVTNDSRFHYAGLLTGYTEKMLLADIIFLLILARLDM